MTFQEILFYIFSTILLVASIRVVMSKNPVHAVLFLVLAFVTSAGLWMLMQAEFLAIVLVLVYVGAVMVLFLFVVMMLDVNLEEIRKGFWKNLPIALIVGAVIAIEITLILTNPQMNLVSFNGLKPLPADYNNIRELGLQLYTTYLMPFELASVLLVLGMVAAIALTHRKRTDVKRVNPADQVKARPKERVRVVQMSAEVEIEGVTEEAQDVPESPSDTTK
ncbi:NADH-quinone oxidoreductase subunit J [Neisseria sp. Ec49-e6-T10]|uniref:NADH-quinone oxidoreductase subunit J n=1 Tax=Neisseria sp. Ec49-e6-T10 TaxID=3140744 RepID=UPI003EBF6A4F